MALQVTGSINVSGSIESNELSGSFSGSFQGDGSKLTGVGGTNPTTGSMPLNISGSFVDSPITAQQGGQVLGGTQFTIDSNNFSSINIGLNPGDNNNFTFQNNQTLGTINDPVIWQVTTELNSGDGNIVPVGTYNGTLTNPPLNSTGMGVTFSNDSGWTRGGSDFIMGASSAGIIGITSTLSVAAVTTAGNLSIGGTIGGVGESTTSLTPSEINLITFGSGAVISKGNIDYIQFNTGQATNLVDNQTYSALTLGASTTYPSNNPSTYTREWVYLAEGNADLNLGVGSSILYTDNPNQNIIVDDTGNRNLSDYNSPAGLGQLDVATVVGSGGTLTTTGDISVTGNITGAGNLVLSSGDDVSLPTINYGFVSSGFESDILNNGSGTTDVVYLTFNTGSGIGLVDGQTYSPLTFDDGTSKTFTTNWIYIDENNSDRAFPIGESRLYALENGDNGDLFVQKSPASSVGDLAQSLIKLFSSKSQINNIGIRHGEKLHETLLTSEEFSKSKEFDNYFKVPLDSRDLNYTIKSEKENEIKLNNDYNSHKTKQLSVDEIISKLLELSYIQNELS